MPLSIRQSATALGPSNSASFFATGGTAPYVWSVLSGGAGGTIGPSTGVYLAPFLVATDPRQFYDTITVTDSLSEVATARILVGTPLMLLIEIIRRQMALSEDRVYLFDQKIREPSDAGLFIVVSLMAAKPFANVYRQAETSGVYEDEAYVCMHATIDIDLISRSTAALTRKEELILALKSTYSRQQQDANGFYIATQPMGFVNLSGVDGAAIPYRYKITIAMQWVTFKNSAVSYFDDIGFEETVNP